jgi:hypothetical protein
MNEPIGLTRRSLIYGGATAGVAVAIGMRPPGAAALVTAGAASPLTRSAYVGLEGTTFTVATGAAPVKLRLESVADLASAETKRALVGSDDAFALTFTGPLSDPLDSGIHTLHHPSLGSFELFSSPVDDADAVQRYEIVVDRSVGVAKAPATAPGAEARREATAPRPEPELSATLVRRASLRRAGRWARCEVVLLETVSARRVRVRLLHKGRQLATATRALSDGRAVMRLESAQRLRAGSYTLVVTAVAADGRRTVERRRVKLR